MTKKCVHEGGEATCQEKTVCKKRYEKYGELGGHAGGEATCEDKAVCIECNESYGEIGEHNFEAGDYWHNFDGVVAEWDN